MNNGKERQNEKLEKLLRKARLFEPSPELKERLTAEAARAWSETSVEIPWQIPVRRLVASAAAAAVIIWLANFFSDHSVARWQATVPSAMGRQQPSEVDVLPEMPYGPFVRRLASVSRALPATDASGLRHHVETVRQLLDEAQHSGVSGPPVPAGGRSRLFPRRSSSSSYS